MFTNEDFDIDEEFLNDISQKETEYYSQALPSNEESPTKKFKNNEDGSKESYSKSIVNSEKRIHTESKKDSPVQNTNVVGGDKTVRANLIFARLKRNANTTSNPSIHQHVDKIVSQSSNQSESSSTQEPFSHPGKGESRKNLILEKLRRNNVQSPATRLQSPATELCSDKLNSIYPNNSKLEHCEKIKKSPLKSVTTCNKSLTLVRQFPGPAGLLPHLSDAIIPPVVSESLCFDNSSNGIETDVVNNISMISKYCSQNTANVFSEGAWQSLISDLTPDFFNEHQISSVKHKVLTNSYYNNKVPFLAGIVQRVDFSCLDPSVVLKDCTGTIEGTVCKNILVKYPNFLDIGVVLFLANVGFLTIGSYPKKCHVIITPRNIMNVYTHKSRIFSIPEMNARLQNLNDCSRFSRSIVYRDNSSESLNSKSQATLEAIRTPAEISNRFPHNIESLQCSDNMNVNSTFEHENLQEFDDEFTDSFLDLDDNLVSEVASHIGPTKNNGIEINASISIDEKTVISQKNSAVNAADSNLRLPQGTRDVISKGLNVCNESTEMPKVADRKQTAAVSAGVKTSNVTNASDIKLKLSVFKSNAVLTPPTCEDFDVESRKEVKNQNESNFTSGLLFSGENDSDEELFSQLDVESIVSNYNRINDIN